MIDESKYLKIIAEADVGYLKKFALQVKVSFVSLFESLKTDNVEPDETWLISELNQAGIKIK